MAQPSEERFEGEGQVGLLELIAPGRDEHAENVQSTMRAGAKLAGAREGQEWPPPLAECALALAWLKRARGFLADAYAAANACATDQLTDSAWLAEIERELDAISSEVDDHIAQLRHLLERGSDWKAVRTGECPLSPRASWPPRGHYRASPFLTVPSIHDVTNSCAFLERLARCRP